jgi:flagellar L-ring protein FlgH
LNAVNSKVVALVATLLCGCNSYADRFLDVPALSPVGGGISSDLTTQSVDAMFNGNAEKNDDWVSGPADYFRDARAKRAGDLITIHIDVNDKANFNSSSNRSRKTAAKGKTAFDVGIFNMIGDGKGSADASMDSSSSGQGNIVRSEKLSVSIAAIVRKVLPNSYMLIEGTQEILVDHEKREVRVSGIIDPRNIAADNSIDYSKIAEVRILYGGSGKVSDSQKPRWGTQLWDKISPF